MKPSTITVGEVLEIRIRRSAGESLASLAGYYKLTKKQVSSIVTGQSRTECGGPITAAINGTATGLPVEKVQEIKSLIACGESKASIARIVGVSVMTVYKYAKSPAHREVVKVKSKKAI